MRRLIPICLLLTACASQYPPTGGGLVAPSVAPTASATIGLAPNAQATFDAAQLQLQQSNAATQAVLGATEYAQHAVDTQRAGEQAATQWVIDHHMTQQQVTRDAIALSMTLEAYGAGATLTALYLEGQQLKATGTAQAVAAALVDRIDAQNKARAFASQSNTLWGMFYAAGILALFGLPSYAVLKYIERKRHAPYLLPDGTAMIEAPARPALPAPKWSAAEIEALDFLAIGAAYIDTHPEQPASQIPSCEKLEKWGASKFIHGDDWQRARNLLGALAASSNRGTFCRDYTVKGLHQALLDKKHPIPYPNPDTAPHSEHSGGILEG